MLSRTFLSATPLSRSRLVGAFTAPASRSLSTTTEMSKSKTEKADKAKSEVHATETKTELKPVNPKDLPVTFQDISTANFRIKDGIIRTPCVHSKFLSSITQSEMWMKLEVFQSSGSFKERGARNSLLLLSEEEKRNGVMCASAGNHALAMAYHGRELGIPVYCVMPTIAPFTKVSKCRGFGAKVILHGSNIGEAKDFALSQPDMKHLRYVNGYDDVEIIAGAGTVGLEILEQVKNVDTVVIPVGGAGLIAGMALAIKTLKPSVEVIGVEPANCASFQHALAMGSPQPTPTKATLADGLAVPTVGSNAFEVGRHFIDRVVSVNEQSIALAVLRLLENEKLVIEGGGATSVAALLPGGPLNNDQVNLRGKVVAVPLCGGNIDTTVLGRVIERGLAADGRLVRFTVIVSDRPGGVAALTKEIADQGGSIKDIKHERAWIAHSLDNTLNYVVVECTDKGHSDQLRKHLESKGYQMEWNVVPSILKNIKF